MGHIDLRNAVVLGYWSAPSASMAENNPEAYNRTMSEAPAGACSCANCGMSLIHNVIVRIGERVCCIGRDCAERIGGEVERAVRANSTTAKLKESDAEIAAKQAYYAKCDEDRAYKIKANREKFHDVLGVLMRTVNQQGVVVYASSFYASLGDQLEKNGSLSPRQASFVVKAMFPTGRRNKKNSAQWDALEASLIGE